MFYLPKVRLLMIVLKSKHDLTGALWALCLGRPHVAEALLSYILGLVILSHSCPEALWIFIVRSSKFSLNLEISMCTLSQKWLATEGENITYNLYQGKGGFLET